ncbi:MAG: SspB family protein [Pseudomonadota bacterium]
MSEDLIRYDVLAQEAMRGVVKKVLTEVMRAGLPGEHHFYITFNTQAPGVRISSRLRERYPEEMTIVIQHQFWDLEVNNQSFEIGLAFSGVPERLMVPFGAIKSFVDPSVQFGLQFDISEEEFAQEDAEPGTAETTLPASPALLDEAKSAEEIAEEMLKLGDEKAPAEDSTDKDDAAVEDSESDEKTGADIVSLDAFRKKAE